MKRANRTPIRVYIIIDALCIIDQIDQAFYVLVSMIVREAEAFQAKFDGTYWHAPTPSTSSCTNRRDIDYMKVDSLQSG